MGGKMSKYNSVKTIVDGIKFDSKKEADRYCELKLLERSGVIGNLELQPVFVLENSIKKDGKTIRAIKYIADFRYYDNEKKTEVIEDVKGFKTKEYQLKKKLFEMKYPDSTITEI